MCVIIQSKETIRPTNLMNKRCWKLDSTLRKICDLPIETKITLFISYHRIRESGSETLFNLQKVFNVIRSFSSAQRHFQYRREVLQRKTFKYRKNLIKKNHFQEDPCR